MHWYAGFRDPAPAAGEELALFEWAGGLPALTRMSGFLYEKHEPADPLLAALFAGMPPDQPQRLAAWLAGAIGGPAGHAQNAGVRQATGFISVGFGAEQRARWVTLAGTAAGQTGLPAGPGFRSAFSACVDWLSRTALAQSQAGAAQPPPAAPLALEPLAARDRPRPASSQDRRAPTAAARTRPAGELRRPRQVLVPAARPAVDELRARPMVLWRRPGHAAGILGRLQEGSMPCGGVWPAGKIEVFKHCTGLAPVCSCESHAVPRDKHRPAASPDQSRRSPARVPWHALEPADARWPR